MSNEERWLYEEAEKDARRERSESGVIVPINENYVYRFYGGREEVVDLSKVGVPGLCCPHIRDVLGATVLKHCELQPVTHATSEGYNRSYAQCGPLAYVNHWEACPFKEGLGGKSVE